MRALHGLGAADRALDPEVLAGEARALFRPHGDEDLERLFELREANARRGKFEAVGAVLPVAPAAAEAHD